MNTISYCLFGDDPMYHVGAIRNATDALLLYPGWEVRVYSTLDEGHNTLEKLRSVGAKVEVVKKSNRGRRTDQLIRLNSIFDCTDEGYFIIRDVDSRFTYREIAAVHQWISSGKDFHVMRDHPSHTRLIMGGMWGGRKGLLRDAHEMLMHVFYNGECDQKGSDQHFLEYHFWPRMIGSLMQHDSCCRHMNPGSIPYPTSVGDFRFIGEQIDENERPKHPESWKHRHSFIKTAFGIYA